MIGRDIRFLVASAVLILAAAQALSGQPALRARLAGHLRFLSSDELQGRLVGEAGNKVAARYIAEQFRSLGLDPAAGGDYLMPLPLSSVEPSTTGEIRFAGNHLAVGTDVIVLSGAADGRALEAVAADLGNEVAIPAGALSQKAVITSLRGLRGGFGGFTRRRARAIGEGAAALIEIYLGDDWDRLQRFAGRRRIQRGDEVEINSEVPHLIVRDPEQKLLQALQDKPELRIELTIEPPRRTRLSAHNVGAIIRGHDPSLANEYVLLSAHFDHVGAGPDLPGATEQDSIFNGARDNAMGVVALLAAAESLAASPAARSVILVAFNAEEQGIVGSTYYLEHPAVPLAQTVFVLNTDGGGFTDRSAVTLIGKGKTSIDSVIEQACAELELRVLPAPPRSNLFQRSDNIGFARLGVPALTFSPGFERFDSQAMPHYHRPSDEAGPDFDYEYLEKFATAFARTGRRVADHPDRPQWKDAQPYAEAARQLYGSTP